MISMQMCVAEYDRERYIAILMVLSSMQLTIRYQDDNYINGRDIGLPPAHQEHNVSALLHF
jgi:hypothetical protein